MQLRWTNVFNPGQDYRLVVVGFVLGARLRAGIARG
jgi:hypothetical protein